MASFDEHINQAKKNLAFLIEVNSSNNSNWDWQVTICFYIGVHLINAHLARVGNLHYRNHEDVRNAISPVSTLSICQLPESVYLSYVKLEGLSRRARYLCNEDFQKTETRQYLTYDKHFAKAIINLDRVFVYFQNKYGINFNNPLVSCRDLNIKSPLTVFKLKT